MAPVAVLAAVLLALTGCSSSDASSSAATHVRRSGSARVDHHGPVRYVALGDSYTAAPYVPVTALAHGCLRSSGNYPHVVAKQLGMRLHDVSCGGANTDDITNSQDAPSGTQQRPQIDAVQPEDQLVTVGIGGNDDHLFGTLVDRCLRLSENPSIDAFPGASGSCAARVEHTLRDPRAVVTGIGSSVARVLRLVHRRAPHAVVVLVGYPRLVSATRTCDAAPLVAEDRRFIARLESLLHATLARAALSAGARFADMYRLSRGHEICSSAPWVNGSVTDRNRGLAFHPFAAEQQAVAAEVVQAFRGSG